MRRGHPRRGGHASVLFRKRRRCRQPWLAPRFAFRHSKNLYITDPENSIIVRVSSSGSAAILAGDFWYDFVDGPGYGASFNNPSDIAIDNAGNLYVADLNNSSVRQIVITSASATVTTLAFQMEGSENPSTGNGNSSSGGGGGAPSAWFLLALGALAALRLRRRIE